MNLGRKLLSFLRRSGTESLMYRPELFKELISLYGREYFKEKRILEIGPKDGLDSLRLDGLEPSELVLMDLPEKSSNVDWLKKINCQYSYITNNFMYMSKNEKEQLGKFKLIWCTGVLYHNPEQLRMLRKLYLLLEEDGVLVLESATARNFFRNGSFVEIYFPKTYRDSGTVTHLPSKKAIKDWLLMVGFMNIKDSKCYLKYNRDLFKYRYACICKRGKSDDASSYYQKSKLNPNYTYGDSE